MAMMKTVEERNQEELKKQVTEDFLSSLEDLIFNDRAAINNVTVMAKDTVEHADAVSKAIIQHVLRVSTLPISLTSQYYDFISDNSVGPTRPEASCIIRPGLHRQEHRHAIHPLPG